MNCWPFFSFDGVIHACRRGDGALGTRLASGNHGQGCEQKDKLCLPWGFYSLEEKISITHAC